MIFYNTISQDTIQHDIDFKLNATFGEEANINSKIHALFQTCS